MPQDSFSVNDVLPPDPEELTSTFRVIFLGAKLPEPKDIDLQYALTVDRKKVKAALEWLVGNNELYKRRFDRKQLRISQANLAKFPDKPSVPQVVRDDAILRSVDSSKLTADMSSYTRPTASMHRQPTPLAQTHTAHIGSTLALQMSMHRVLGPTPSNALSMDASVRLLLNLCLPSSADN